MAKFTRIEERLRSLIEEQKVFFVGTAAPYGRVNIAPKGMETLRVMAPNRIVWLNLTGAENETAAHLAESPRMTIMWCSFATKPMILRVYGNASMVHSRDDAWDELAALFPPMPGARQIFDLDVNFVLTSCGFGVPLFEFVGERDTLRRWAQQKGEEGLQKYWAECNQFSIDGKPTSIFETTLRWTVRWAAITASYDSPGRLS
jgi:hypothetical protein